MSFTKARRLFQASLLLATALALSACGFHLRETATLPLQMKRVHLVVRGDSYFQRHLARALETSGATVEERSGPGIAELHVPTAQFSRESLTAGGYVRIIEFAVRYHVEFEVIGADGRVLVPNQPIDMSREYSYDSGNAVGSASQVEELQRNLNDDMVQAILFRLQAGQHRQAAPAAASSTP